MKKTTIVLPTYNEEGNIDKLIESIFDQAKNITNWEISILVVDSKSKDRTADDVRKLQKKYPNLHLLTTEKEGLGKAYVRGYTYAIEKLNPFVLIQMDADLSHDPKKIPEFLHKIEKGADFVYGSRYMKGGSIPEDWGFHRKVFSFFGNLVVRFGFMKWNITDWTNGYRAVKTWVIRSGLNHVEKYSGYVFQIALMDFALKNGANIKEVPINFKERNAGKSKINSVEYITHIITYVLSHSSFVKFVIVGLIGFAVDFSFAYFFIHSFNTAKPIANTFSAEIAIIFNFFLNNFWSFGYKKIEGGAFAYVKKLFVFNVVSSGSIFIQWLGMTVAIKAFGDSTINLASTTNIQSWIVYKVLIIALLIIPYSYILYNKVIWKKK